MKLSEAFKTRLGVGPELRARADALHKKVVARDPSLEDPPGPSISVTPRGVAGEVSFSTAGGSSYTYDPKTRTTVRNKGHGSNPGPKERSQRTLFLNKASVDGPEYADVLNWVNNKFGRFVTRGNKLVMLGDDDKTITTAEFSWKPSEGSAPLEFWGVRDSKSAPGWNKVNKIHLGNDIVVAAAVQKAAADKKDPTAPQRRIKVKERKVKEEGELLSPKEARELLGQAMTQDKIKVKPRGQERRP